MSEWKEFKKKHYLKKDIVNYQSGFIDFNLAGMKLVKNGSFKNYDEYLEIQKRSINSRRYLGMIYLCEYSFNGKDRGFLILRYGFDSCMRLEKMKK